MALERVRFLHTSDWHLEEPLAGLCEVPSELRDEFIETPYRAAERVVDEAIREAVDFVLLAGDILPTESASPYTLEFVLQQFEKLHAQGILVYWIGGLDDDPDLWPTQLTLPNNVRTFPVGRTETFQFTRDEEPIAEIAGQSARRTSKLRVSDFAGSNDKISRIVLAHGSLDAKSLESKGVDYWALGGRHHYERVGKKPLSAYYSGSPQGRLPAEVGRFTCNLVELKYGDIDVRRIDTAVARWHHERLHLSEGQDLATLEVEVRERLRRSPAPGAALNLLTYEIACDDPRSLKLTPNDLRQLMKAWRSDQDGDRQRTVDIKLLPADIPEEFWDEDSILGDFLRVVRDLQQQPESDQQLESYLPDSPLRQTVLAELRAATAEERHRMWQEVAALGVSLLRGDTTLEAASSA